jgi:hypothetical protein
MDNRCVKDNTVFLKKQGEKSAGASRKQKNANEEMAALHSRRRL